MKKAKRIIGWGIWSLLVLCLLLLLAIRTSTVQSYLGGCIANILSEELQTEVRIGSINLALPNRIILDDVHIKDQSNKPMLDASRLAAKVDILPTLRGKISIPALQLFGVKGTFYKRSEKESPNFQFVLDALSSKDTTQHKPLDLHIGSIVVQRSGFTYDRFDKPRNKGSFDINHICANNLNLHCLLPEITDSTVDATLKQMTFTEGSGLDVRNLSFKLSANNRHLELKDLNLQLPKTYIKSNAITASYERQNGHINPATLQYEGVINHSTITPSDFSALLSPLSSAHTPLIADCRISGTSGMLQIHDLAIKTENNSFGLKAKGSISSNKRWFARLEQLQATSAFLSSTEPMLQEFGLSMPDEIMRLGDIDFHGEAGGIGKNVSLKGQCRTDAGDALIGIGLHNDKFTARLETEGINLSRILENKDLGTLSAQLSIDGNSDLKTIKAKGNISRFDYKKYSYHDLTIDGIYKESTISGQFSIDDPNIRATVDGEAVLLKKNRSLNAMADIKRIVPQRLGLSDRVGDAAVSCQIEANLSGATWKALVGDAEIDNLNVSGSSCNYQLENLKITAEQTSKGRKLRLVSDFAELDALESDGFRKANIQAEIRKSDWLNSFFNLPIEINEPIKLRGERNADTGQMSLKVNLPQFSFNGIKMDYDVNIVQADGKMRSSISWDNHAKRPFKGVLNCTTDFFNDENKKPVIHARVHESEVLIDDTLWHIRPSDIVYRDKHLIADYFSIDHDNQRLSIYGKATPNASDSLTVELQDINVEYILNLVNFHTVNFSGLASGKANLRSAFSDSPMVNADLCVNNFCFEGGNMGTLHATASYENADKQIDIHAHAEDKIGRMFVDGYISPAHNHLDLEIKTSKTHLGFIETFCSSFMRNTDLRGDGYVRLAGFLRGDNSVNLSGLMTVNGPVEISPLNTRYTIHNGVVRMVPDEIYLEQDTIIDEDGNTGVVGGAIHHKSFSHLTFDINVNANRLLAYDFDDYGDNTFFGKIKASGSCFIKGRTGRIDFDVNVTPEKGSFIEYNAASPDAINDQEFIRWGSRSAVKTTDNIETEHIPHPAVASTISSDLYINFLINAIPDNFTLRLLTDKQTGDYISLNGAGSLRASYYNKGTFDMFGNYLIENGIYKLTIQNIIKRDFEFQSGSMIVFGGDPYNASINLKALHTVNSVSLSSLGAGQTFKNNNVRADCIMNITGTPANPNVEFDIDFPTLSADNKQMVKTIINSQEELNQQAISLLAIGQFYNQNNNARTDQQNQTSLAMQSILSGTVSQQINNVLSSLTNNKTWSIGANISTGDEGWNNAEYEGLLEGKLLNNRLLINGQFGYRDNNTTNNTSFIGDFDIRYLLLSSGNLAVRVYNQTNDRYFTRNSLNTQGLGLILKKDFNTLGDLFGRKK